MRKPLPAEKSGKRPCAGPGVNKKNVAIRGKGIKMEKANLLQQINQDLTQALKKKDVERARVLRTLKAVLKNAEIEKRGPLQDKEIQAIIQKEVKKRQEAVHLYQKGGRPELARKEEQEIKLLQNYLPEPLSEQELDRLIKEAIKTTGAESVREMGKVMGAVMGKVAGRAEGAWVAKRVREILSSSP